LGCQFQLDEVGSRAGRVLVIIQQKYRLTLNLV
jgi:hypothetical protein